MIVRKCSKCLGRHHANYRLCPKYQDKVEKKSEKTAKKSSCLRTISENTNIPKNSEVSNENILQILRKSNEGASEINKKIFGMLESIDKKLDDQYKRINSLEKFKQEQILKKVDLQANIDGAKENISKGQTRITDCETKISTLETSKFVKRNE